MKIITRTFYKNLTKKKQVDEVEKSFKKMEMDIRQNNELIMDINSDKEKVKSNQRCTYRTLPRSVWFVYTDHIREL